MPAIRKNFYICTEFLPIVRLKTAEQNSIVCKVSLLIRDNKILQDLIYFI
ncbi:hypothetical protein HMPREF9144_1683 [Prevotella pallens ATCC 700821]|uniref:Uncharacterized protein n=2 Tax=Prevotella pallens TaxID=60133 RepID=F9DJ43_9BACT|nr:hypothetical protein HMPREF9144_1683 [Prevotella pallens ATCC 700821]RAS47997.1 hypothetical protein BC673_10251 [Prevotella pallens]